MTELIGYVSAICLGLSGMPFALAAVRQGHARGTSIVGTLMVIVGMAGMLVYESLTAQSIPQMLDFALAAICWSTVLRYRLIPR